MPPFLANSARQTKCRLCLKARKSDVRALQDAMRLRCNAQHGFVDGLFIASNIHAGP